MKKFFSILLTILIISMCSINVMAADVNSALCGKTTVTIGDWVYEAIDGGSHWELDEYVGNSKDVIVPRIVNDRMVVSIGSYCFFDNTIVKNVETSSPLWTVSDYAFLNCTSLESFVCNFALKEIKVGAFYGTTSLKSINLEDSVVTEISPHAFTNSGITSIKLPETCTKLGNYSFDQCKSLTNITIPDSVTEISDTAFANCSNNLAIICNSNSYAAQYAESKGITCFKLDQPQYGDANSDGKFNIRDATAIQYYRINQMNLTDYGKICADVDHNGSINIRDVTYIQMKIAKIKVPDDCF